MVSLTLLFVSTIGAAADGFPPPPPPVPALVAPAARLSAAETARLEEAFSRLRAKPAAAPMDLPPAPRNVPPAPSLPEALRESVDADFARLALSVSDFGSLGQFGAAAAKAEVAVIDEEPAATETTISPPPKAVAAREMLHLELDALPAESLVGVALTAQSEAAAEPDLFGRVHAKYGELAQR